ncbi:MAG: hypothetical protein FJ207_04730 [Gemmatimonadetes bacterium]|nr:hypothetical protein [Gemmatimonadota bacterium]
MNHRIARAAAWPQFIALTLTIAVSGCASRARVSEVSVARDVVVTVENQNYKDAVVYAIWGAGPRDRLGMVTGNTTQTFESAVRGGGELRVEVDFLAGVDLVAERMDVFEGDDIHVLIPPHI